MHNHPSRITLADKDHSIIEESTPHNNHNSAFTLPPIPNSINQSH